MDENGPLRFSFWVISLVEVVVEGAVEIEMEVRQKSSGTTDSWRLSLAWLAQLFPAG